MKAYSYPVELTAAMGLYALLLVGANMVDHTQHPTGAARMALALTPMIGAVAAAWVIMRKIWRLDELQRRIQLDAIAVSFLATALITFGWGFAQGAGAPSLHAHAIWPMMALFWVVGVAVAHRRYR